MTNMKVMCRPIDLLSSFVNMPDLLWVLPNLETQTVTDIKVMMNFTHKLVKFGCEHTQCGMSLAKYGDVNNERYIFFFFYCA